jgi:hypothetical protein
MLKAPYLGFPSDKPEDIFVVCTDASRLASGGSLHQLQKQQDGTCNEVLLAYTSKAVSSLATHNYSVLELEMVGLLQTIYAFKHLLGQRHFLVWTDHKALYWKSMEFSFEITYVPPKNILLADMLSRHPNSEWENQAENLVIPSLIDEKEICEMCVLSQNFLQLSLAAKLQHREFLSMSRSLNPQRPATWHPHMLPHHVFKLPCHVFRQSQTSLTPHQIWECRCTLLLL